MAVRLDHDIGRAAVGLGHGLVVPGLEAAVGLDDLHVGPTRGEQALTLLGDGGILQAPELLRVGEVPILAEQVGGDAALIRRLVEQCGAWWRSRHRPTATP